ncbi:MAG: dienelactone hydrolase family protein [Clostridia bacterium]|nr:dienelactone hydrolase family protein [Clostridia bacterium]
MNEFLTALLQYTPSLREHPAYNPSSDAGEVQAVTFSLPQLFQKEYETFAYIGFPKIRKKKMPAVVLVHGGLGHAYFDWVRLWNARGYVAIAMDMEGYYPEKTDMTKIAYDGKVAFTHGAYGCFKRDGLADSSKNDAMQSMDKPLEEQWMFHSIAKGILAHNILRSFEEVEQVGICGISWGSVITSLIIGYDLRFDFAVSIYGGGYMLKNQGFCGDNFRDAKVSGDRYLAEKRFNKVKIPTLFVCGDDDAAFSIDANSLSYNAVKQGNENTRFSIVKGFKHGQNEASHQLEPFFFADSVCKDTPKLIGFKTEPKGRMVCAEVTGDVKTARAYYLEKSLQYGPRTGVTNNWPVEMCKEIPCVLHERVVTCTLPDTANCYYVTIEGEREGKPYFVSSPLISCAE